MTGYLRSRRSLLVVVAAVLVQVGMLAIDRPIIIRHVSGPIICTLATPLQIVVVGVLALGLSGRMEQFEFAGVRRLWMLRLLNAVALSCIGTAGGMLTSIAVEPAVLRELSVGPFGQVRAFLGLFGVALAAVSMTDMRLGALCALPLVVLPVAFDLQIADFGSVIGFVLAESGADSWTAAVTSFGVGLTLYVTCYTERNAPSANRPALVAGRSTRRSTSTP